MDIAKALTESLSLDMPNSPQVRSVLRASSLPFCGREYIYALSGLETRDGFADYFLSVGTTAHTVMQNSILRYALQSKLVKGTPPRFDIVRDFQCQNCKSWYPFTPIVASGLSTHGCHFCKTPVTFGAGDNGAGGTFKWFESTVQYRGLVGHMDDIWLVPKSDGSGTVTLYNIDYKTSMATAVYSHRKTGNVFPKYGNEFQLNSYSAITRLIVAGDMSHILPEQNGYVAHPYKEIGSRFILNHSTYNIKVLRSALVYVARDNPGLNEFVPLPKTSHADEIDTLESYNKSYEKTRKLLLGEAPPIVKDIPNYCNDEQDFKCKTYCPLNKECSKGKFDSLKNAIQIVRKNHGL
jgi:hypothetical protein